MKLFLQMFSEGEVLSEAPSAENGINAEAEFEELIKGKYSDAFGKRVQGIIDKRFSKMKAMEKDLSPDLFAKYKSAKADRAFPVYVPLDNGHCSGCRVEIPTAKINKLKAEGTIVCECHRVIYNK